MVHFRNFLISFLHIMFLFGFTLVHQWKWNMVRIGWCGVWEGKVPSFSSLSLWHWEMTSTHHSNPCTTVVAVAVPYPPSSIQKTNIRYYSWEKFMHNQNKPQSFHPTKVKSMWSQSIHMQIQVIWFSDDIIL